MSAETERQLVERKQAEIVLTVERNTLRATECFRHVLLLPCLEEPTSAGRE